MEGVDLVWEEGGEGAFAVKALVDGQVVGRACGRWNGDRCELERVDVLVAWRRRGIGRSLVGEAQWRAGYITARAASAAGAGLLACCGFVAAEPGADWAWPADGASAGDRDF